MEQLKPLNLKNIPLEEMLDKKSKKRSKKNNLFKTAIIFISLFLVGMVFWLGSTQSTVFDYVFGKGSSLKSENGRINVLLLGIAGGNHDGPNLTDTIMVASYNLSTRKISLISLPRDIWIDKNQAKINAIYQMGLLKGNGLEFAKKEIGDILGLSIPYAIRVDFSGFTKAVDLVGGVDVNVINSFDDYSYPVPGKEDEICGYKESEMEIGEEQAKTMGVEAGKLKVLLDPTGKIATAAAKPNTALVYTDDQVFDYFTCRFEHLVFKKGPLHMNGETALKFVRSRHGTNNEGSDFARARRQQLVLQAFRQQILSFNTLTDLSKIVGLVKTFGASIDVDIPQSAYVDFAKLIRNMEGTENLVIDTSGKNPLLVTPNPSSYGGAWVLIPQRNDFSIIQKYIQDSLSNRIEEASNSALTPAKK